MTVSGVYFKIFLNNPQQELPFSGQSNTYTVVSKMKYDFIKYSLPLTACDAIKCFVLL